ncbi:MAG: metallophosphoesterase family protein [Woeseiaceae bacterium]
MAFLVRFLKRLGLLFLAILAVYAVGRPTQMWLDGFYSGEREPYLQMMSMDAVTIRWQSENDFKGVVKFGEDQAQLNKVELETASKTVHEVRITNLKPNTTYFYSAGDESEAQFKGNNYWFKTSPLKQTKTFRFWVTGDQGYANKIQTDVRDAAYSWASKHTRNNKTPALFDLWLTTGDNAYRSGTNEQFQTGFFEPYKQILTNTPVWPTYGNHDARRWVFYDIFTLPTQAESGGVASGSEHYYSFDYADVHFLMLDTQDSSHDVDGDMLQWLKKDLAFAKKQNKKWLVAVFHHPPYSKGSHDSDNEKDSGGRLVSVRENILPLLESSGVDLVLSGHSHMYERSDLLACHYSDSSQFKKEFVRSNNNSRYTKKESGISLNSGTVYTVIGSSSKLDNGPLDHPALPHSLHEAGSMIIDINQNSLKAYFINNNGKVKDQFEIVKGKQGGVSSKSCIVSK